MRHPTEAQAERRLKESWRRAWVRAMAERDETRERAWLAAWAAIGAVAARDLLLEQAVGYAAKAHGSRHSSMARRCLDHTLFVEYRTLRAKEYHREPDHG